MAWLVFTEGVQFDKKTFRNGLFAYIGRLESMKKITDLTEIRTRTIHVKDAYGNRLRETEEYVAKREVRTVATGARIGHFMIDAIVFNIIIIPIRVFVAMQIPFPGEAEGLFVTLLMIMTLIAGLLYPVMYAFFEYMWQRTPGKFITKTCVIDEYANKPDLRTIILRSVIRIVPFEPLSCVVGKESYGWHDEWSKTWVVTEIERDELKRLLQEQNETN